MSAPAARLRRRTRLFGASGVALILLVAGSSARASAMHGNGAVDGTSDALVAPPAPSCPDPIFTTEIGFDSAGNALGSPRFGTSDGLVQAFDVPAAIPAGVISFDEIVTFDGYQNRPEAIGPWVQTGERVFFELLADGVVVASTAPTHDLPDGSRSAWSTTDLGTTVLDDGADTLRIRHSGDTSSPNSLLVSSVCLGHTDLAPPAPRPEPEPDPEPDLQPEPAPEPVVSPPSPAEPAVVEVLPAPPVQAAPGTEVPALAITGTDGADLAIGGLATIACGLVCIAVQRRLTESS